MALGPLAALGGLVPEATPVAVTQPGIVLDPSVMGGPYNPAHGEAQWEMGTGYPTPWAIQQGLDLSNQPATAEGSLTATPPQGLPAGQDPNQFADAAITGSHGAPWMQPGEMPPIGSISDPEAYAARQQYMALLHSVDTGDVAASSTNLQASVSGKMPWGLSPDYVSSGAPEGPNVGDLTGNNRTGRNRFGGWAAPGDNLNTDGMDSAHVVRENPAGNVPVPLDTMQGAQRPMVLNIPGRYGSYPVGTGSPFAGDIPGVGNDVGAAEIGVPSDYQPPPDAPTNPVLAVPAGTPVWGWTGLGY
jgi:hypothetical protein